MRLPATAVINVVVIAFCIVGVSATIARRNQPDTPPIRIPKSRDIVGGSRFLGLSGASRTLLLVTASSCHFCEDSMAFYRTLTAAARKHGTRVVAVSWEPPQFNRAHLQSQGVFVDAAVSDIDSAVAIPGTPLLILVGQDARISRVWAGMLDSTAEQAVLSAVARN